MIIALLSWVAPPFFFSFHSAQMMMWFSFSADLYLSSSFFFCHLSGPSFTVRSSKCPDAWFPCSPFSRWNYIRKTWKEEDNDGRPFQSKDHQRQQRGAEALAKLYITILSQTLMNPSRRHISLQIIPPENTYKRPWKQITDNDFTADCSCWAFCWSSNNVPSCI